MVFCIKSIVSRLQAVNFVGASSTELMITLEKMLHLVKDVYDSFWEASLDVLLRSWNMIIPDQGDDVPLIHASLRLYNKLKVLAAEESNEDLVEAWQDRRSQLTTGLLKLLQRRSSESRVIATILLLTSMKLTPTCHTSRDGW